MLVCLGFSACDGGVECVQYDDCPNGGYCTPDNECAQLDDAYKVIHWSAYAATLGSPDPFLGGPSFEERPVSAVVTPRDLGLDIEIETSVSVEESVFVAFWVERALLLDSATAPFDECQVDGGIHRASGNELFRYVTRGTPEDGGLVSVVEEDGRLTRVDFDLGFGSDFGPGRLAGAVQLVRSDD